MALQYGKVIANIIELHGDSSDSDEFPDVVGASNVTVTFLPAITQFVTSDLRIVNAKQQVCTVDENGVMRDSQGHDGVWLLIGQYTAKFSGGHHPDIKFFVTEEHTAETPYNLGSAIDYIPPVVGTTIQMLTLPSGGGTGQTVVKTELGALMWADPPKGDQGDPGPKGADSTVPGPQGEQGPEGPQGIQGEQGPAGADSTVPGPKGDKGDKGDPGDEGPPGADGADGADGDFSVIDAKGDLIVGTADNSVTRLPAGTNGHVLTADSGEAAGVKWAAAAGGGGALSVRSSYSPANLLPNVDVSTYSAQTLSETHICRMSGSIAYTAQEVTGFVLYVSTGQPDATLYLALYRHLPETHTGTTFEFVADLGTVDASTTGTKDVTLGASIAIDPGVYAVAIGSNVAGVAGYGANRSPDQWKYVEALSTGNGFLRGIFGYITATPGSAWPSTVTTTPSATYVAPRVQLKVV